VRQIVHTSFKASDRYPLRVCCVSLAAPQLIAPMTAGRLHRCGILRDRCGSICNMLCKNIVTRWGKIFQALGLTELIFSVLLLFLILNLYCCEA